MNTLDREIWRLEIKKLLTDDPEEKEKVMSRLMSAYYCRSRLHELPGAEILFRDGIEIR